MEVVFQPVHEKCLFRVFSVTYFQTEYRFSDWIRKVSLFTSHIYPADTDVFKTFSGRLVKVTTSYDQTRSRYDVWKKTSDLQRVEDVWFTSSWKRPTYDVLKTFDLRCHQDVWFTMSWRRLIYVILKTSNLGCLENVWFTTSSGRLIYDVLKTSDLPRLEHIHSRCLEDVWFMMSWRRLIYDVLKTSVKRRLCSNFVETSIQRRKKWFFFILYCVKYSENSKFSSLS